MFLLERAKEECVEVFFLVLMLLLNGAIATWNAWIIGRCWPMAGSFGTKLLLVCGYVQSGIGYSSVLIVGLVLGGYGLGWLDVAVVKFAFSLWYVLVIVPLIGTGFVIWLHSVLTCIKDPSIGGFAVGAWNTYAMYSNISSAVEHLPAALEAVGEGFSGLLDSKDGWRVALALLIVAISIGLGFAVTHMVFRAGKARTLAEIAEEGAY